MLFEFTVSEREDGMRLDYFLRRSRGVSSALYQRARLQGRALTADGLPRFGNQPVRAGERVAADLPDYDPAPYSARTLERAEPADVLYEDGWLLAAWKPPLLQTHPSSSASHGADTLELRVAARLGAPAHPVHRLDAETSGIVLFAKHPYVQSLLQGMLQQPAFQKEYHALCSGVPRQTEGRIDAPIARAAEGSFTRRVDPCGQRASTRYRVDAVFSVRGADCACSRLTLFPETGRTHQLRVHLASLGCPILGDVRYGDARSAALSGALGVPRLQLCACALRFCHPVTQEEIRLRRQDDLLRPGVS